VLVESADPAARAILGGPEISTVSWFLFQCRDEAFRPVRTPAS
jgi:hypothetical protein